MPAWIMPPNATLLTSTSPRFPADTAEAGPCRSPAPRYGPSGISIGLTMPLLGFFLRHPLPGRRHWTDL